MKTIKVSSLPLKDVISDIAAALGVSYSENCNLYELKIPNDIGTGTIKGIDFDDGMGLIDYDCTFIEDVQFEFSVNKVHPLKFLFCVNGLFHHKFENGDSWNKIPRHKNAIVASSEHNGHILNFSKGERNVLQSLEIARKEFQKKVSCELKNLSSPLKLLLNDIEAKKHFYYEGDYSLELADLFTEWNTFEETAFVRKLFLEGLAYKILTLQIIQYQDDLKDEGNKTLLRKSEMRQLREAVQIIENRIDDLPTIEEMAAEVGLNPKKLQRGFQKILGSSVNTYVQRKRLDLAKALLSTTERPISEISSQIGFKSKSYLAKIFKHEYGVTPSEYRLKMKGN